MMGSAMDFNPEGVEQPFHPERELPCLQRLTALSARELPVRLQSRKLGEDTLQREDQEGEQQ